MSGFVREEIVPLGLDFEMPEQVWVLMNDQSMLLADQKREFYLAWPDIESAQWGQATGCYYDLHLAQVTMEFLRARQKQGSLAHGVILLDAALVEIGRRYFR